jgi:Mg-chelatase subunit ChlD
MAKPVSIAAATPPPSLALEANPNAHLRALPPEAVLSPSPAPHLNGHDGIVFLLDISGSMYEKCAGSTRLAMARDVLSQRIRALKDGTPFAITVYAQTARNSGPLVAASNATREAAVHFIQEDIDCGGGTDLPSGLASAMLLEAGNLVLISDGDLNTTLNVLMDKARSILNPGNHGPMLTIVGISPRHNTDASTLLKSLASLTGGSYVAAEAGENTALLSSAKNELPAR